MQKQDCRMDQAAEDVRVIRDMMEKAGSSLHESSSFFLWAGLIFLSAFLRSIAQSVLLMFIEVNGSTLSVVAYISNFFSLLELIGVIIVYFVYRSRSRRMGEIVGRQLCSLWGFLLISSFFIGRLLPTILQLALGSQLDGGVLYLATIMPHFIRCLLIAAGLFVSGLLMDRFSWKVFSVLVILLSLIVLVLTRFTVEIPLQGNGASMTFAPATSVMTAMPAVTMLIIWAVVRRK